MFSAAKTGSSYHCVGERKKFLQIKVHVAILFIFFYNLTFVIKFFLEIIVDSREVVKNNTEKSRALFVVFLMVYHLTNLQYNITTRILTLIQPRNVIIPFHKDPSNCPLIVTPTCLLSPLLP